MKKESRQKAILEIISAGNVETQNQLMDALHKAGISSTQATISRDIKELRLVKELTSSGTYRYAAVAEEVPNHSERLSTILRECLTSADYAQNIVVIKTLPALASAACSAVDRMDIEDMLGTLAGDDTAFIALRTEGAARKLCQLLRSYL